MCVAYVNICVWHTSAYVWHMSAYVCGICQRMCVAHASVCVWYMSVYVSGICQCMCVACQCMCVHVCSAHAHMHTGGGQRESEVWLYFSLFPSLNSLMIISLTLELGWEPASHKDSSRQCWVCGHHCGAQLFLNTGHLSSGLKAYSKLSYQMNDFISPTLNSNFLGLCYSLRIRANDYGEFSIPSWHTCCLQQS